VIKSVHVLRAPFGKPANDSVFGVFEEGGKALPRQGNQIKDAHFDRCAQDCMDYRMLSVAGDNYLDPFKIVDAGQLSGSSDFGRAGRIKRSAAIEHHK